ncbi:electron transfer flavoprotein subunit beta/FixA family protein [Actinotalea sp. M2MS4P-6]|uniref:electron transfer flavoprotein subunit beta/FixA family protein n=1 Tax=Actinotalea sp. M2MS4P-6 TaxID=2983762 RepID=UPI0021E4C689|nr:electron transfer flavoprotein subunit beta/FixA family protein [Actinotalea sp. M2MS4P-6]MCV2393825.1 electron transfer flavoprotein subunit beta/FixA family protein [Actinotalea sp. M2MS4P-6]
MTIAVCVKHVPDPADPAVLAADLRVDREAAAGMLCSLDEYAVDRAVQLRHPGERVVAVTMGPRGARAAVTRALQMGADEGLVITDPSLAGADAVTTAAVLAAAVRSLGDVDLVLCGMSSTDGSTGTVPPMVADLLGWGCAGHAVAVVREAGHVTIERDDPDARRTLVAPLPAVVSVTDLSGEPSYPSFKAILAAKRRPVREVSLAELPVRTSARGLRTVAATVAPPRAPARIVTDVDGSGAHALVQVLTDRFPMGVS